MRRIFYHAHAFYGTVSERWAIISANFNSNLSSDVWYIDIYSSELDATDKNSYVTFGIDIFPWKFNTLRKSLIYMNDEVNKKIKAVAKQFHDETNHKFEFGLTLTKHCTLNLGKWLHVNQMTSNLSSLLRLPQSSIQHSIKGVHEAGILLNRSRQLYLLSNMVQATTHGNKRLPILCDFLHSTGNDISEKRFDPISYIPIVKPRIDFIHLQLTDDQHKPVKIKDSKTLVTL